VAKGRYAALGVAPDRLALSGNIKLAGLRVPEPGERPARVVFGNVHRVELAALGPGWRSLARAPPGPRNPAGAARFGPYCRPELLTAFGDDVRAVEGIDGVDLAGAPVWVDRMGVLAGLYGTARVGVVCGTFGPIGGHDLSEPLQQGAATFYGPHTERQRAGRSARRDRRWGKADRCRGTAGGDPSACG